MFFFPYELRIVHTHYQREIGDTKKGDFIMNKFFTKIAALFLGMTMAVGVGVAVGAGSRTSEVDASTVTYKLTIDDSHFNTTSYAANNNEKTTDAVCTTDSTKKYEVKWTSNQVMKSGSNMQWQKNNGYLYNSTDLGTITDITVTSSAGSFTKYYGTSEHPTSGTTVGNGFFTVKVGNATGKTSKVEITFNIEEGGSTKLSKPTDLEQSEGTFIWSDVEGASSYTIEYDGNEISDIDTSAYEVENYTAGKHQFRVKAIGDGENYSDSDWSDLLKWDDRTKENLPVGEYPVQYIANGTSSVPEDGDQTILEDSGTTIYKTFKLTSDKFTIYSGHDDEYSIGKNGGYIQFQNESNATLKSIVFDAYKYNNLTCVATGTITPSSSTSGDHLYLTYDFGSTNPEIVTFTNNSTYDQGIYQITLNFEVLGTVASIAKTADLTKDEYTVGETFSTAGLVVTGTYTQGGTFDATSKCTFSPANGATLTQEYSKLTITYSASNSPTTTSGEDIVIEIDISVTFPSPSETIAAINAIGTVAYTQASYNLIKAARDLYKALPAESQAGVTNIQTLIDAEESFATLKTNAVNNVISLITAIGEVTLESGDEIETAEAAYTALLEGDLGKSLVTNYSTLTAARTAYNKMVSDKEAADAVTLAINNLPSPSSITDYSHHADIVAARTAYEALTDDQKDYVLPETLQKLVDCETEDAKYEPKVYSFDIAYTDTTTTTNMTGGNDAAIFGLDSTLWSVVGVKGGNNNYPGLNKSKLIKLYANRTDGDGNEFIVSVLDETYTIESIVIDFAVAGTNTVYNSKDTISPVDGTYTISDSIFTIKNVQNSGSSNVTIDINKITVTYSIEESETADAFLDAVDAIPAVSDITTENIDTVNALIATAESEYAKLTEELKQDAEVVSAKSVLDAAKEKATDVNYEVEAADTVAAIAALPNPEDITDYSHHADILNARYMYNALSENAKAKVTNISKLIACEEEDQKYAPALVVIDTDGGNSHDSDSDAPSSEFANAAEIQEAYPVGTSLLQWSDSSKAYGDSDSSLKLSSSSVGGSITLSFAHNRMYATSVTIDAKAWTTKTTTLTVNGVSQTFSGVNHALTFDLSENEFSDEITISNSKPSGVSGADFRVTIFEITVAYAYRADYSAAKTFETDFIKKDIAYPDVTPTGVSGTDCLSTEEGGKGYYDLAEARYNSAEFGAAARLEFATHDDFAKARERFQAWALANGKSITFNQETGAIEYNTRSITLPTIFGESSNATAIVVIVSVVSLTAIGGYFFLKKRREQN